MLDAEPEEEEDDDEAEEEEEEEDVMRDANVLGVETWMAGGG